MAKFILGALLDDRSGSQKFATAAGALKTILPDIRPLSLGDIRGTPFRPLVPNYCANTLRRRCPAEDRPDSRNPPCIGEPSDVQVSVVAVGLITAFEYVETILVTGEADLIALARVIVFDPRRLCKQQRILAQLHAPKRAFGLLVDDDLLKFTR